MEPKIVFLGTGADSFVVGKQLRGSGGIIIHAEGCQFHIDPGPGSLVRAAMYGINLRETTAVLVSNNKLNTCNDIDAVVSAMTYDGLDRKGVIICSSNLINGDNETAPALRRFSAGCVERIIIAKPNQKIGVENIEIQTLETRNSDASAIGFKFITPGFVLSYASDTSYSKDLISQYMNSGILVLNVREPSGGKPKDSLSTDDAVKIVGKVKPSLAIIRNFGKKILNTDPLYEARTIQKQTGVPVIAATDGMAVNPLSYSVHMEQKTLNLYPPKPSEEVEEKDDSISDETSG